MIGFKLNKNKGVALFIAVLATSALLLIALAISDISYKEQVISYSGRDSKIAFYAANSGLECILYHDLSSPGFHFATSSRSNPNDDPLKCFDADSNAPEHNGTYFYVSNLSNGALTTVYFNVSTSVKSCAIVQIWKTSNDGGQTIQTKIEASGYNNSCLEQGSTPTPTLSSFGPRTLERTLFVTY